jgi:hypothetical protein
MKTRGTRQLKTSDVVNNELEIWVGMEEPTSCIKPNMIKNRAWAEINDQNCSQGLDDSNLLSRTMEGASIGHRPRCACLHT